MARSGRYTSEAGSLPHVYWITGGSCAGKSSVADALAERHGIRVLHTDPITRDLFERADADREPSAAAVWPVFKRGFLAWMELEPSLMFDASYDLFGLLLHEVRAMGDSPLVVEGMLLSPRAVHEVSLPDHAICLTGSDAFLRSREREHPFVRANYEKWDRPEDRIKALTDGHIRLTHGFRDRRRRLGMAHIDVDSRIGLAEVVEQVEKHFRLGADS